MKRTSSQHKSFSFCVRVRGCTQCGCVRLGFPWITPPPAVLPVNPSLFITRRDTPTEACTSTIFPIKIRLRFLPSLIFLISPGVSAHRRTDADRCHAVPAGRPGSFRIPLTYNHLLHLIHCDAGINSCLPAWGVQSALRLISSQ